MIGPSSRRRPGSIDRVRGRTLTPPASRLSMDPGLRRDDGAFGRRGCSVGVVAAHHERHLAVFALTYTAHPFTLADRVGDDRTFGLTRAGRMRSGRHVRHLRRWRWRRNRRHGRDGGHGWRRRRRTLIIRVGRWCRRCRRCWRSRGRGRRRRHRRNAFAVLCFAGDIHRGRAGAHNGAQHGEQNKRRSLLHVDLLIVRHAAIRAPLETILSPQC
jgi:hypothetical protein